MSLHHPCQLVWYPPRWVTGGMVVREWSVVFVESSWKHTKYTASGSVPRQIISSHQSVEKHLLKNTANIRWICISVTLSFTKSDYFVSISAIVQMNQHVIINKITFQYAWHDVFQKRYLRYCIGGMTWHQNEICKRVCYTTPPLFSVGL